MRKPPPNVLKLPLHVRAELALKAAVEQVMEEHAREGRSVFVWRDGKVVEITGAQLRKELRKERKRNAKGRKTKS
jgi:hypothetical protein